MQDPISVHSHDIPATYRVVRAILRLGTGLFFPRLRTLNREKIEQGGPAILLITHPESLTAALLLVAALDRPVRCLLPSGQVRGIIRKLAVWVPGIRFYDSLAEEQHSLLDPCLDVLADQGIIAIFAGPIGQNGGQPSPASAFAARLSLEALLPGQAQVQPALYPIHWFLRSEHRGSEPLVYVDGPVEVHAFLPKIGEDVAEAPRRLAEILEDATGANVFALAQTEAERFTREVEGLSREHLEEQWAEQPEWKQQVEDLELSSFVRTWIDGQNRADPARLVELREAMDRYREARRRYSMGELVIATSGAWHTSNLRTVEAWVESVLGFPVAIYGLVNHLPAGIVLAVSGLLKKNPKRDPNLEWLLRSFIVLSFYTVQVFLANLWWGRATAGYYTLTLPVSGAYLWRYRWLIRHRTHVLLLKALHPGRTVRLVRKRKEILDSFDREIARSPQSPAMPCVGSTNAAE
ncbi:MAG: hypothetical protein P8Z30_10815 [Acidobacteriota bacterium]